MAWAALELLTDHFWPVTLFAFGPRWLLAPPAFLLALAIPFSDARRRGRAFVLLVVASSILVFGVLDGRLGLARASGHQSLRIMTQNVGGNSRLTARALNQLMDVQDIDIATLQECGIPAAEIVRLGWHVHANHHQCLISRYAIEVVDVRDPMDVWRAGGSGGIVRYELQTPLGRLNLLTLHLETIRDGLEAVLVRKWEGLDELAANRRQSDIESGLARAWSERGTGALIVTGDFNLPVNSAIYRRHWGHLGNAFSACGRGFGYTKRTRWFGVRIDHILMSDEWRCTGARLLDGPQGDHTALVELVRY